MEDKERAALAQRWHKEATERWWDADFSWEGLAKKDTIMNRGRKNNTLQDYWRNEADHLIKFDGKKWTRFHLPLVSRSGKRRSEKADWTREQIIQFEHDIEVLIEAAWRQCEIERREAAEANLVVPVFCTQADLTGVVFPRRFEPDYDFPISAVLRSAQFPGGADFMDQKFVLPCNFERAFFEGYAWFDRAEFPATRSKGGYTPPISLDDVVVLSNFDLPNATVQAHLRAPGIRIVGALNCYETVFEEWVNFSSSALLGGAVLEGTKFNGPCTFSGTRFASDADFSDVEFHNSALFFNCKFDNDVDLSCAVDGGKFGSFASFVGCEFGGACDFNGRTFVRETSFARATFHGAPLFHEAKLHTDTSFQAARFLAREGVPDWGIDESEDAPPEEDQRKWFRAPIMRFRRVARAASRRTRRALFQFPFMEWLPMFESERLERQRESERLEAAYRSLRRSAQKRGNLEQEGLFYALEIGARRHRTDIPIFERFIAMLFDISCGYGQYALRPLAWFVFLLICAVLLMYFFLIPWSGFSGDAPLDEVASFTARMFIPPPPVWSGQEMAAAPDWARFLYKNYGSYFVLAATVQVTTTIGLLAAFLLTLRRRFAVR